MKGGDENNLSKESGESKSVAVGEGCAETGCPYHMECYDYYAQHGIPKWVRCTAQHPLKGKGTIMETRFGTEEWFIHPNREIMGRGFECQDCGAIYNYFFNFCPDCGRPHKSIKGDLHYPIGIPCPRTSTFYDPPERTAKKQDSPTKESPTTDKEKEPCERCGKNPQTHWVCYEDNHEENICCECHMKEEGVPADWHPECMRIYREQNGDPESQELEDTDPNKRNCSTDSPTKEGLRRILSDAEWCPHCFEAATESHFCTHCRERVACYDELPGKVIDRLEAAILDSTPARFPTKEEKIRLLFEEVLEITILIAQIHSKKRDNKWKKEYRKRLEELLDL